MEFIIGAIVIYVIYKLLSSSKPAKAKNKAHVAPKPRTRPQTSNYSVSFDDDEEELATFTIRTGFGNEAKPSSNKSKGRWLDESQSIQILGRQISKGFFYYGGILDSIDGYGTEPSLVDEKRSVSKQQNLDGTSEVYSDDSLGYWPSYATLSKQCRGIYLDWLASDRSIPEMPVGYVFIYFYGFERRIIENKANSTIKDGEFLSIFNEVSRLNKIYWENR